MGKGRGKWGLGLGFVASLECLQRTVGAERVRSGHREYVLVLSRWAKGGRAGIGVGV